MIPVWAVPALIATFVLVSAGLGLALHIAMRPASVRGRVAAYVADVTPRLSPTRPNARWKGVLAERRRMRRWSAIAQWHQRMATDLMTADLPLRPIEWMAIRVGVGLLLAIVVAVRFGNPLFAEPALLVGAFMPPLWLRRRRTKRRHRIESQLPDALDLIANAVRSGQTFARGLKLVADELPAPMSTEAATALAEIQVGVSVDAALDNLSRRTRLYDIELIVAAVQIQQSVGGDLGEVLRNISATIRERGRIKAEVRALTAQGRLSGWVIGLLPIGLAVGLALINPDYMRPLFTEPLGRMLIGAAATLWVLGFVVVRRVVTVDF